MKNLISTHPAVVNSVIFCVTWGLRFAVFDAELSRLQGLLHNNKTADELPPTMYLWPHGHRRLCLELTSFPSGPVSPEISLWQPSVSQDLGLTAKFTPALEPFSYSWEAPIKPLAFNFLGNHGLCNLRWTCLFYGRLSKVCPSFFFSQHGICLLYKRKVPQKLSCVTSFC